MSKGFLWKLFLNCCCFVLTYAYYDFTQQYLIQNDVFYVPCSKVTYLDQPISGETIFSGSNMVSTWVSEIMVTGWFMLKGYYPIQYKFMTISDSTATTIFDLRYDITQKKLFFDFKQHLSVNYLISALARNKWYFLKVQLILGTTLSSLDTVNILLYSQGEFPQEMSYPYPILAVMKFNRATMQISIGKYFGATQQPSCAFVRQLVIFMSPQPWLDSSVSSYHDKMQQQTYLYWGADFFYTLANFQTLLIQGTQYQTLTFSWIDSISVGQFNFGSQILNTVNPDENQSGLMVYLEFMIPSIASTNVEIIDFKQDNLLIGWNLYALQGYNKLIFYAESKPPNTVYFYQEQDLSKMFIPTAGKWYQLLVSMNAQGDTPVYNLIIKGDSSMFEYTQPASFFDRSKPTTIKIKQDDQTQTSFFDNIRIYQGALVSESISCKIQVASKNSQECLICQVGYILSYQTGMTCVLASSGPSISKPGIVLDWPRTNCPPLTVYEQPNITQCTCLEAYYNSNGSCSSCPNYCDDCTGATTCAVQDPNRDTVTGSCRAGYFNNGQECVSVNYRIPYKVNLVKEIPTMNVFLEYKYQLRRIELEFDQSNSFIMSFYLIPQTNTLADYSEIVAYAREGITDVFLIQINYSFSQQTYTACFYYLNASLSCLLFDPTFAWIGLWTDFSTIITLVETHGQVMYNEKTLTGLSKFIDPVICIGICLPLNISPLFAYFKGTMMHQLQFITDIAYPIGDRFDDFLTLSGHQSVLYFEFNPIDIITISSGVYNSINQIQDFPSISSTYTMNYSGVQIDPLKGFFLTSVTATLGQLSSNFNLGQETSFSLNIVIPNNSQLQQNLFAYTMNGWSVSFSNVFSDQNKTQGVSICFDTLCKTAYNCPRESNLFIAIIQRELTEGSLEVSSIQYDIVCNEQRELIQFDLKVPLSSYAINGFVITNVAGTIGYHINNLRIFTGSNFYFDYTLGSNCYLYYDVSNMKCLRAMDGYAMYHGEVVTPDECILFSSQTEAVVYNRYTRECMKIHTIIPGCLTISDDLTTCTACIDPNTIVPNCFTCPKGYFKPTDNSLCQQCHEKCSSCQDSAENCLECTFPSTLLPNCECSEVSQYRDSSFQCQPCSHQCGSCANNPDSCLTCSEDRISLPACTCNPQYYNLVLSTTQECKPIVCATQCETCEYLSIQCITCASPWKSPPACDQIEITCSSDQFYDQATNSCKSCDFSCSECNSSSLNCTSCGDSLFLVDSQCLCSDMSAQLMTSSGSIICSDEMNVSLSTSIKDTEFKLILTFDEVPDIIDFSLNPIQSLVSIYISQVAASDYSISNVDFQAYQLILTLKFTKSISSTFGNLIFKKNVAFKNVNTNKVLAYKYLSSSLDFQVPLILSSDVYTPNKQISDVIEFLNQQNQVALSLFRQFQIIFYVLNTLQPCVGFLMVNIPMPSNLFQYMQSAGILIFPTVLDLNSQSVNQTSASYSFASISLENENEVSQNSNKVFNRFSFSNSMLVNIPITLVQSFLYIILLFNVSVINGLSLKPRSPTIWHILLKSINSNIEACLLLVSTAIFNQFLNVDTSQYFNTISLYLAIILLILQTFIHIFNFQHLHFQAIEASGGFKESNSFFVLIQNFHFSKKNQFLIKYYYLFAVMKKYCLSAAIVFIYESPALICAINSVVLFLSVGLTIWIRPYNAVLQHVSKIGGDICILTVWMIFMIKFIPLSREINKEVAISESVVIEYLGYGNAALILLAVFNGLYLIEFLWVQVFVKAYNFLKTRCKKQDSSLVDAPFNMIRQIQLTQLINRK